MFFFFSAQPVQAQENLLAGANGFDNAKLVDNPWGGVNNGVLTVLPGWQSAVNDAGAIVLSNPGASVAIGDFNGDTLPDLVVADAKGFFWFFPNSGTATQPKFTYGEVMPIWIGNPQPITTPDSQYGQDESEDNTVPRINLVDFDRNGKLGIVAGNYEGKLYYIPNTGTSRQPVFSMPPDLTTLLVPTYSEGKLWCNFLAPFLYDWRGNGVLDLLMGEGTYASNSIYLLTNKGSNQSPTFNEAFTTKIIPGLGREHLTPQVVDWNNDGKPDIITGERMGYVDVFLNTTTDPSHPQFDQGQHVTFGGKDTLGQFTTVAVGDLTGNKLPNLVISSSDNKLLYAENKGTPGNPQFNTPLPIQGKNPLPQILAAPPYWIISKALGIPYVNLVCTSTLVEPDFKPPSPEFKSALKYYTEPHAFNTDFPTQFYPQEDTQMIAYFWGHRANNPRSGHWDSIPLKAHTHYTLSFWVRSVGEISNFVYLMHASELDSGGHRYPINIRGSVSSSDSWTHFSDSISFERREGDDNKNPTNVFTFQLAFNGHPTLYFDGFSLTEDAQ